MSSYKYLGIDIYHKLNWNYSIKKMINGGWKDYFGLENNCKATKLVMWDRKKLLLEALVTPIIFYGCEVWGCIISRESWRNIEKIQKCPKTPWVERICHLCENMNIEDENHFLLKCLRTPTLDLNFIIFFAILTFLDFQLVKIIVSLGRFSPSSLSREIQF